jgi:hypothetical protein
LTTEQLSLGPNEQASVGLSYTGRGEIEWGVSSDSPWLSVTPTGGRLRGETVVLTVRTQRTGLGVGTYQGRLSFEASGGRRQLIVTMRITTP